MPLIPENIRKELQAAQNASNKLTDIAAIKGCYHKFTLDGRFVGDVGELLAVQHFDINPHQKQTHRHDAFCNIGDKTYGVQIKCRRESTVIDFYSQPDLLLVIKIDSKWESWEVIYNGPGDFLSNAGFSVDENGKLRRGDKKGRRFCLHEFKQLSKNSSALKIPERHISERSIFSQAQIRI